MALSILRLKKLVTYRERLERLQEREFAFAVQRRGTRLAALRATEAERSLYLGTPHPGGILQPEALLAGVVYRVALERRVEAQAAALAASEREVAEERATLLDKRRDREAVQKLLDRAIARAKEERGRAERIRIDEVASVRWLHNSRPVPGR